MGPLHLVGHRLTGIPAAQELDVQRGRYPVVVHRAAGGQHRLRREMSAVGAFTHRTVGRAAERVLAGSGHREQPGQHPVRHWPSHSAGTARLSSPSAGAGAAGIRRPSMDIGSPGAGCSPIRSCCSGVKSGFAVTRGLFTTSKKL